MHSKSIRLTSILLLSMTAAAYAGGTIKGKVIHKRIRWVRNTVIYIESAKGEWKPGDAKIDQQGSTFIPKFLPVIVGSKVTFHNSDPTNHNVYSPDHEKYDLGAASQGKKLTHIFEKVGVYTQLCKLHPTMLAYVIVLPNPYYALSDKTGNFTIENVPPGKYKLIIWNERYKGDSVEVGVKEGGTAEIEVKLHR